MSFTDDNALNEVFMQMPLYACLTVIIIIIIIICIRRAIAGPRSAIGRAPDS